MSINRGALKVDAETQRVLDELLDSQARQLVEDWAGAFDSVATELEAALRELADAAKNGRVTGTQVVRSERLRAALGVLARTLQEVAARAGVTISAGAVRAIQAGQDAAIGVIVAQLGGKLRQELAANILRADPTQILAMIDRLQQRIIKQVKPIAAETMQAIRAELLRGITVGANPREVARRIMRTIEDRTNMGLNRALNIARTEMIDAHRVAAKLTDNANSDVLAGWVWLAHLGDDRTCRACLAMHGTMHELDEPGPLGHQGCRCARMAKTKSWADLGFKGIEDAADITPDADAWFDSLPEADQKRILGVKGWQEWKAGRWPREKWATRQTNDGWRDSYVAATAPRPAKAV